MKSKSLRIILLAIVAAVVLIYMFYKRTHSGLNSETVAMVNGETIPLDKFEDRLSIIKMASPPDK
ncbi:MAG: hypothetical protein V1647_04535, partial [Pseudomonadota bacterium]